MAKKGARAKAKKPRQSGPHVAAAVFCDQVVEAKDGSMSIIRIIDRVNVPLPPAWNREHPFPVFVDGLITLKSGDAKGDHQLSGVLHVPGGEKVQVFSGILPFTGEDHSVNVRLNSVLNVRTEGLYWLDVVVNKKLLTRMSLRISFEQAPSQTPAAVANEAGAAR
jgi:hypothetical protein